MRSVVDRNVVMLRMPVSLYAHFIQIQTYFTTVTVSYCDMFYIAGVLHCLIEAMYLHTYVRT
jgi:hypothetical protein